MCHNLVQHGSCFKGNLCWFRHDEGSVAAARSVRSLLDECPATVPGAYSAAAAAAATAPVFVTRAPKPPPPAAALTTPAFASYASAVAAPAARPAPIDTPAESPPQAPVVRLPGRQCRGHAVWHHLPMGAIERLRASQGMRSPAPSAEAPIAASLPPVCLALPETLNEDGEQEEAATEEGSGGDSSVSDRPQSLASEGAITPPPSPPSPPLSQPLKQASPCKRGAPTTASPDAPKTCLHQSPATAELGARAAASGTAKLVLSVCGPFLRSPTC